MFSISVCIFCLFKTPFISTVSGQASRTTGKVPDNAFSNKSTTQHAEQILECPLGIPQGRYTWFNLFIEYTLLMYVNL